MSLDADALAEMARNRGLKLRRSRVRIPDKPGFGMFGLVDAAGDPVFGIRGKRALRASADEIADYLRGLEKKDWKASLRAAGSPGKQRRSSGARDVPSNRAAPPPHASAAAETKRPVLREATAGDARQLASLFALLDHRIAPAQVARNLKALATAGEPVLVISQGDRLLGACAWHATPMPHRDPPVGRITLLVLAEQARGRGLGRQLVAEAERRLMAAGCGIVEVTSNDRLTEAHAFYRHLGYERTSMRFAKPLTPG